MFSWKRKPRTGLHPITRSGLLLVWIAMWPAVVLLIVIHDAIVFFTSPPDPDLPPNKHD